jgi:molybdate transport system substrate-binding protein
VAGALAALALSGCGGNGTAGEEQLKVSAAASLKRAFDAYGEQFDAAYVRASFAGSDELAAQIEQGVRPDVFAAANTKLPDALYAKGLVEQPQAFATNRLVVAVPADSTTVRTFGDLAKRGVKVAAGSPSVPVGTYTRKVLAQLDAGERNAILANIRSNEPDVAGIVGKLSQGAVDAGFVYVTDVEAAGGKLKAIDLPPGVPVDVTYGVAVVKGGKNPATAREFIDGLLSGAGLEALRQAGFGPPPS